MASPIDAGRIATTAGSTAAQNKPCALPASLAVEDLLLLIVRSGGADTHTTPTGWSDLVKNTQADASTANETTSIFYKKAAGDEGSSVTVPCTTSLKWAASSYRITGGEDPAFQVPQVSTIALGTTTTVNPTAVTPTGGSKTYLMLWIGAWDGEQTGAPPTAPTNYANGLISTSGTGGAVTTNAQIATYSRQVTTASEDPAACGVLSAAPSGSSAWTLAIHPPALARLVGAPTATATGAGHLSTFPVAQFGFAHGAVQWRAADPVSTMYTASMPFAPKALRVYWLGLGSAVDLGSAATHLRGGVGFATSPAGRAAVGVQDQDAAPTITCTSGYRDDCVAFTVTSTPAVDGRLDLDALLSDGFRLIVDQVAPADLTIFWEAWGGTDITDATVLPIAEPAATGDQDYTAAGFVSGATDQVVLFAGTQSTAAAGTAVRTDAGLTVGFASGTASAENTAATVNSADGTAAGTVALYMPSGGECLAMIPIGGGTAVSARAQLTQWNTGGFRLNWIARGLTDRRYVALAIKGGSWRVGTFTLNYATLGATATVSGLPFAPIGLSGISACALASTAGTATTAAALLMLGTASSPTSRQAMGLWLIAGAAASEVNLSIQYDQVFVLPTRGGGPIELSADLEAMAADGFTLIVDDILTQARTHGYLTFAEGAVVQALLDGDLLATAGALAGLTAQITAAAALHRHGARDGRAHGVRSVGDGRGDRHGVDGRESHDDPGASRDPVSVGSGRRYLGRDRRLGSADGRRAGGRRRGDGDRRRGPHHGAPTRRGAAGDGDPRRHPDHGPPVHRGPGRHGDGRGSAHDDDPPRGGAGGHGCRGRESPDRGAARGGPQRDGHPRGQCGHGPPVRRGGDRQCHQHGRAVRPARRTRGDAHGPRGGDRRAHDRGAGAGGGQRDGDARGDAHAAAAARGDRLGHGRPHRRPPDRRAGRGGGERDGHGAGHARADGAPRGDRRRERHRERQPHDGRPARGGGAGRSRVSSGRSPPRSPWRARPSARPSWSAT